MDVDIVGNIDYNNNNDDDDIIMEDDNDDGTTLKETDIHEQLYIESEVGDEDLTVTTNEDIILTLILGQKSNGVITRSKSIRHQDELYVDVIEGTKYTFKDTIDLDDDDVDIIDFITEPITPSSSSSSTTTATKKRKKGNLTT
jgi:hypothetical protein